MPSTIYIVEDHPLVRELLSESVGRMKGLSVSGTAASAEEALAHLRDTAADLVLLDLSLPGMSGTELVAALLVRHPSLRCLMLSGHRDAMYVEQAFAAGARGFVLKGDPGELEGAIRQVLGGGTYLSEALRTT